MNTLSFAIDERQGSKQIHTMENTLSHTDVETERITKLYVVLFETPQPDVDLSQYFCNRMCLKSGSDMSFHIIEQERVDSNISSSRHVVLAFPSYKLARHARSLLMKHNSTQHNSIHCFYNEHEAVNLVTSNFSRSKTVFQRNMNEIVEIVTDTLNKHDEKLRDASKQLENVEAMLRRAGLSVDEFSTLTSERGASDDKLREFELQRKEFTSYVKCMKDKLLELEKTCLFSTHIREVRKTLGVECRRLDAALPMYAKREQILHVVKNSQVCVIIGETGSGKSTQMTQYLYQAGMAGDGLIACTQPRKIAAVSLATHVASELASSVGQIVGYQVGMKSKKSAATRIMYTTDHALLNECLRDGNLSSYSCIIIDEAHERSIYTDLLLGMLKKCLNRRPELKVIVTSATINPDIFVSYFGGIEYCPVLRVSGRAYPVQCIYDTASDFNSFPDDYERKAVDKAIEIHKNTPITDGGILVFMTTPLETEKCCANFQRRIATDDHQCLQLHGKLQVEDQQLVFNPPAVGKRKIIFATNSAETSITIAGIKFVVDTGVVKEMRFDSKKNMNTLSVVPTSQSSSDQRKGRAGRTAPGICHRLYSKKDFDTMTSHGKPEILRIHLGQGLLTLLELGVDPSSFDFVESPPIDSIENAMLSLRCLGAVSGNDITDLGKWLAKMPVEPRLGFLIKLGIDNGVPIEGLVVAACCTSSGIFFRAGSEDEKKEADLCKIRFCHHGGDLLTMLNVYREWNVIAVNMKGKWCKDNSINGKSMKAVRDMVTDVLELLRRDMQLDIKHELKTGGDVDDTVQKLIFQSMNGNLCYYLGHERAGYMTCEKHQHVRIHPSSSLLSLGMNPTWVVFGQLLKTSDDFITNVTPVSETDVKQALAEKSIRFDVGVLESQKVGLAVKVPVGRYVNWKFVGPMHINRRQLEETISIELCDTLVVIESDKEKGCVELYTVMKYKDYAKHILLQKLSEISEPLLKESREETIGNDRSGVRAVIQSGIAVRDILTQDQYRAVRIKDKLSGQCVHTDDSVLDILSRYGTVEYVTQATGKQHQIFWGHARFVDAADAERATNEVNADEQSHIRIVPITMSGQKADAAEFTLKLTWCRRPAKGICYVYLERPEDQVRLQMASPILHDGDHISIMENRRGEADLYMKGLEPDVKETDLKQTLGNVIDVSVEECEKRFRLVIPRENVAIGATEINDIQRRIIHRITSHTYIDSKLYSIYIRDYKPQTAHVTALVHFQTPDDCQDGIRCLGIDFQMNDTVPYTTVHATMDLRTSFHVRQNVYAVTRTEIESYISERKACGSTTKYNIKILKSGSAAIDINSVTHHKLAEARLEVQQLVEGDILTCDSHKHLSCIFMKDGRQQVQDIEKETGTAIFVDHRTQTVGVHGSVTARKTAVSQINAFLKKMEGAHEARICLKGEENPPGLMKHMIFKYGLSLTGLKQKVGLLSVSLNFRYHVITMSGTDDNVSKAISVIDKLRSDIASTTIERATDMPNCPICLCPIHEHDVCRLEYCGHAYCKECLKALVTSAVHDKDFPIKCAADGCEQPLVIRDLNNQIGQGNVRTKTVTAAALNCFVEQNNKEFRYCITPDCQMVYRVTSDGKRFFCSQCQTRICTTCHIQFHDGMTCAMYKSAKDGDNSVEAWMKENPEKRKQCPNCKTGIEKIEGCNHMTCKCRVHICWVCLEFFSSGQDCYGHLAKSHGSFM